MVTLGVPGAEGLAGFAEGAALVAAGAGLSLARYASSWACSEAWSWSR